MLCEASTPAGESSGKAPLQPLHSLHWATPCPRKAHRSAASIPMAAARVVSAHRAAGRAPGDAQMGAAHCTTACRPRALQVALSHTAPRQ